VPRWTIILASTINASLIFVMNLLVIILFFAMNGFLPSFAAIFLFILFSICIYIVVLSFALITAPLYVKFRDLSMIWEVLLMIILYASPIIYPLTILPAEYHQLILLNPIAFIVHFTKEALINNHFASLFQYAIFFSIVAGAFVLSIFSYRKFTPRVAEEI
jgi:ABC-type polysaccharide/polyol phosphate export permease